MSGEQLTEREIKTLYKLLAKFKSVRMVGPESAAAGELHTPGEQSIIGAVRQWVKWYADENTGVEL